MGFIHGLLALSVLFVALFGYIGSAEAAIKWLPAVTLSSVGQSAAQPQITLDARGNAMAVWTEFDGTSTRVRAAFRPAGESFGASQKLSAFGQNASRPQVAFDQNGNALAIWSRFDGATNRVQAAVRGAGGAFGPVQTISAPGVNARFPQVAFDQQGNALAIWEGSDGTTNEVEVAFRAPGGIFGSTQSISVPAASGLEPKVAFDRRGNALAIWERFDGTIFRVQAGFRPAGGAFGSAQTLSAPGVFAARPQVAFDHQGNAIAVWDGDDGTNFRVQAALRPTNGAFGSALIVSAPGGNAFRPEIAVDKPGNALAIWQRLDGTSFRVQVAFRGPTDFGFGPVQNLSEPGKAATDAQVAVDPQGNGIAAWILTGGSVPGNRVQAAFRPADESFEFPQTLSEPGQVGNPKVAIDPQGNAVAVWERLAPDNRVEVAVTTK